MGQYRFLAYDAAGNRVASVMDAASPEGVKQRLWADGLFIVDIHPRRLVMPALDELFPTFLKVRRSELILFSRQLATFVRVGVPLLDGLAVLRDQASSRLMKKALSQVIRDVTTGSSLSVAMSRLPTVFPALYVEMVRAAEVSGHLDEVLRQLAHYMSRDESSARKIQSAMIYPLIVVALALGVITLMVTFVLPAFDKLFQEFNTQMPPTTRFLLWLGVFSSNYKWEILAGMGLVIAVAIAYFRTPHGRTTLDGLLLRIPGVGTIVRFTITERYLRTLATLARSGVPIAQMLETANRSVGNVVFTRGLAGIRARMLSGEGFTAPLAATGLFPRMVVQMVKVGEETGNLDSNLEQAADHFGEEVDYRLKRMITVLEPTLVLVVGILVGFIAISVIAPMYGLVRVVSH